MKVLITGGGGFAGRHLISELSAAGYEDIAATVVGTPPEWGESVPRVDWHSMDLTDADSVRQVIGRVCPTAVYHLAGQASVSRSLEEPLETWDINATGTIRVLLALRRLPFARRRFLLVSSAEVYGHVPEAEQPISEDAAYRPVTPYGASKAAAEIAALQESRGNGIDVVTARSFNHIGPGQDSRFLVPNIARQLARIRQGGEEPVRAGNLSIDRDFLDVRDAVRGYRYIMEKGEPMAAYNVCSGNASSLADVVRRMIDLSMTGASLELDPERMRSVDIPSLKGDATRLFGLGWQPRIELDQTLRDLLAESPEG